jgi:hypothetical protein
MAVIDELVVKLGLDPKQFDEGQRKALNGFKNTVEDFRKQGQIAENQSKSLTDFLSNTRTQALALFAVFTGAKGLVDFAQGTIKTAASVDQLSHSTGVSVVEISKLQALVRTFGGNADAASAQVVTLADAVFGMKIGQISPLITLLRNIQGMGHVDIDAEHGPAAMMASIAQNLENIRKSGHADIAGNLGRQLGLDPALFEAMIGGADKFNERLGRMKGLTQAEADAALKLQNQWIETTLSVENFGKRIVTDIAPAVSNALGADVKELQEIADLVNKVQNLFGAGSKSDGPSGPQNWGYNLRNWLTGTSGGEASFADRFPSGGSSSANPAYREAIAAIESKGSGGYAAVGPVTSSGDRAYGRYQIMGNNIGPWSEAALGKRMSIQEFMASQSAQDAIFDHKFGSYVKQFGNPQDAASAWLTGRPLSTGGGARDLYGTSGASYAQRFTDNLRGIDRGAGGGGSSTTTISVTGPITISVPPGSDPQTYANEFRAMLKRQAMASQANRGQT